MRRRPFRFIALVLATGLLAYGLTRLALRSPAPAATLSTEAQLDWLAREFRLTPTQAAEIARLQSAYAPVCADHCAAIAAAQKTFAASATAAPETRAAAQAELARLERVCSVATRAHLQAVAACMPPDQAPRFLALMEPRIAHTDDRTGAPALAPSPAP